MARRHLSPRARAKARTRNRIYVISALVIIVVAVAVIYGPGPFDKNGGRTPTTPKDINELGVNVPDVNIPEVNDMDVPPPVQITGKEPDNNFVEVTPKPDIEANPEAADLIAEAMALVNAAPSRIIEARDKFGEVLLAPASSQQRRLVKDRLSELAKKWLFSRLIFPDDELCSSYQVQKGEMLSTIGKKFKVPWEILSEINGVHPKALQAGKTIKVINGPFHLKVYRSTFTVDVYLQKTYVWSFKVGLGRPGRQTPVGLWRVKAGGKMEKPMWTDPDTHKVVHPESPDYPLGSRWIELEGMDENTKGRTSFGIHGTKEPESIGTAGSRGCIRLHNGDAIRVYNLLVPVHSLVRVED